MITRHVTNINCCAILLSHLLRLNASSIEVLVPLAKDFLNSLLLGQRGHPKYRYIDGFCTDFMDSKAPVSV